MTTPGSSGGRAATNSAPPVGRAARNERPVETTTPSETNNLADRIRSTGKRLTPQRELILRAVESLGHATPDELHVEVRKQSSAVNLSTVYRNLEVLEELGLVRHTHLSDRAPTYHSVTDHEHFHMVCRDCGRVTSMDPEVLAPFVAKLRSEYDFVPDIGHLTVFGHCESCD